MYYLLVDQIAVQRVDQQVAARGADGDDPDLVEDQPLDGADELGVDRGELRPDLDPGGIGVGPPDDEDDGAVGEGEGVGVERAEEVGVVGEPALLAGADVGEVVAGDAAEVGGVAPPSHGRVGSGPDLVKPLSDSRRERISQIGRAHV